MLPEPREPGPIRVHQPGCERHRGVKWNTEGEDEQLGKSGDERTTARTGRDRRKQQIYTLCGVTTTKGNCKLAFRFELCRWRLFKGETDAFFPNKDQNSMLLLSQKKV